MADTVIEPRHKLVWARALTITGIVIAVLNMVLAWTMMFTNAERTVTAAEAASGKTRAASRQVSTESQPVAKPQGTTPAAKGAGSEYAESNSTMAALADMFASSSQSQERRSTVLLGFCFALIAIGFSLFVMGVEGAIGVRGEAKDFGTLLVKTTSPGLFCIFLSAVLVGMSMLPVSESKADLARAEGDAKTNAIREEGFAKQQALQAEAFAKEQVIQAEANAKERLLRAEMDARLAAENLNTAQPRERAALGKSNASK